MKKYMYRKTIRFDIIAEKNICVSHLKFESVYCVAHIMFLGSCLILQTYICLMHLSDSSILHEDSLSSYTVYVFPVASAMWAFPHG